MLVYSAWKKNNGETTVVKTNSGPVMVTSFQMPISTLQQMADSIGLYNYPQPYDFPINITTIVKEYPPVPFVMYSANIYNDSLVPNEPSLSYYGPITNSHLAQQYADWASHMSNKVPNISGYNGSSSLSSTLPTPNLPSWAQGLYRTGEIPGTGYYAALAYNSNNLYTILSKYLDELSGHGISSIKVTRVVQYQVQEYAIRTMRTSNPLPDYHWTVRGQNGDFVQKATIYNSIKMLFRGPGVYDVSVKNLQTVYRTNQVKGLKTEYWILNNGDAYDGLIIYMKSSDFTADIGQDIGPKLEFVQLLDDGFTANVTKDMAQAIQVLDIYGNIHSPAVGFTTERR
ncbi:MAG: hypothetical protein GXY05_13510 [Clostridiales bacterium]|nr:hypothetical protein [Clostridiales bacterium]